MEKALVVVQIEKCEKAGQVFLLQVGTLPVLDITRIDDPVFMMPFEASFSRFARLIELLMAKAFRSIELYETQLNTEFLRDRLQLMEKYSLIHSAEIWMEMRNVRNRIVHDYLPEQIEALQKDINDIYVHEISFTLEALTKYKGKLL